MREKIAASLAILLLVASLGSAGSADDALPALVDAEIANIEKTCADSGSPFNPSEGFVQTADLNKDGRPDYLIDSSRVWCMPLCGARACQVTLFYSAGSAYLRKDFLGVNLTFENFRCNGNSCDWR
jgi:hypothetical protein